MNTICAECKKPIVTGQGWAHNAKTNLDFHPDCRRKTKLVKDEKKEELKTK